MHGNITNIEENVLKIEQNSDKNGHTSLSISPKLYTKTRLLGAKILHGIVFDYK